MEKEQRKIVYSEPAEYFPEELRKKYKIGEYAEKKTTENTVKKSDKKANKF